MDSKHRLQVPKKITINTIGINTTATNTTADSSSAQPEKEAPNSASAESPYLPLPGQPPQQQLHDPEDPSADPQQPLNPEDPPADPAQVPIALRESLHIPKMWCYLSYIILAVTLVYPFFKLSLRFLQKLDLVLYQFLCFLGVVVLHQGYQKHLPPLYHQVPTYLVYMLHGLIGLFVLYLILVTIFHLLFEIALQENLEQAVLATIRSVVYHGISGSICFIHAQQSIWIKTEGIQLHQEISSRQFPPNGWKKLSRFQTMIQNYNTYSGNAVSIPLLFYFAAAASSCLTLPSYDGWARFLLVALIGCASSVVYLMVFFFYSCFRARQTNH